MDFFDLNLETFESLIRQAFLEDFVHEDVTTKACFPEERLARGEIVLKKNGTISGLRFLPLVFQWRDPRVAVVLHARDGEFCRKGTSLGTVTGPIHALLSAERTALNLVQHLSGIATLTAQCVAKARGVKILDTRKTLPGYRELQKYAVRCGGGTNHRRHLADRVLIKNNHLALVGFSAILLAKRNFSSVEVEVGSFEELLAALELSPDVILLDNMSIKELEKCVVAAKGRAFLEASGGITLETLEEVAKTGVDAISMGQLTHSAPALDIAFRVKSMYT